MRNAALLYEIEEEFIAAGTGRLMQILPGVSHWVNVGAGR